MKDYQAQFNKECPKYLDDKYSREDYWLIFSEWLEKKLDYAEQTIVGQEMIIKAKDKALEFYA